MLLGSVPSVRLAPSPASTNRPAGNGEPTNGGGGADDGGRVDDGGRADDRVGAIAADAADALPTLPANIAIPELVGGCEDDDDTDVALSRSHRDARSTAAMERRARLEELACIQKKEVHIDDLFVNNVRNKLRSGGRRQMHVSDLQAFFDLMAAYLKKQLDIQQVVYANIAPVSILGGSVKMRVAVTRGSKPVTIPLTMKNRSKIRLASGLSLICYMAHIKNPSFCSSSTNSLMGRV
eukprot:TRINITY_DN1614_c0_g1_i1.p1 TRINITY_DN1614_c0_g1~~TRINITY_DN1614_c0_g1_i1.p1  ORF type:complete len:270 (-),score=68.80 TRINITY_DN1614_c0_g1_i1:2121-2831(-)